jgi:hypothetical protein
VHAPSLGGTAIGRSRIWQPCRSLPNETYRSLAQDARMIEAIAGSEQKHKEKQRELQQCDTAIVGADETRQTANEKPPLRQRSAR